MARLPHTLSLSAHTHRQIPFFFEKQEPHHHWNVGTTCGAWWSGRPTDGGLPDKTMTDGTPNGWGLLHIDGNQYTYDYRTAGAPEDHRMRIHTPKVVPQGDRWTSRIVVNCFNGTPVIAFTTAWAMGPGARSTSRFVGIPS